MGAAMSKARKAKIFLLPSLSGSVLQCLDPQDGNLAQSSIPGEDREQNLKTLAD